MMKHHLSRAASVAWLAASLALPTEVDAQKAGEEGKREGTTHSLKRATSSGRTTLDFDNAPLEKVLDHLSTATGAVILPENISLETTLSIKSKGKISLSEAVDAINVALEPAKLTLLLSERFITVVSTTELSKRDLKVRTERDPERIEKGSTPFILVTPTPYLSPSELVRNLTPLLPEGGLLVASEDSKSLIIMGTGTDLKRLLTIVRALDHSEVSLTEISVAPLVFADAADLSKTLTELFSTSEVTQTNVVNAPITGTSSAQRRSSFVAVSEEHSNSIIMRGAPAQITEARKLLTTLDVQSNEDTQIRILRLRNADAAETATLLTSLFPSQNESASSGNNDAPFFGNAPQTQEATPSTRALKAAEVIAVPDARSNALIVRAGEGRMASIVRLVRNLDLDDSKRQRVYVFQVSSDPLPLARVLQETFSSSTVQSGSTAQSALEARRQQNATRTATSGTTGVFGGSANRGGTL